MKLYPTLDYCEATAIETGNPVKIWFYHRSAIQGLYQNVDQNRKALIIKAPKGREIDFPKEGELYAVPLGLVRTFEKLNTPRRRQT